METMGIAQYVRAKRQVTMHYGNGEGGCCQRALRESRRLERDLTPEEKEQAEKELCSRPVHGDYINLLDERHTIVDVCREELADCWIVEDNTGADYRVVRDPDNDNEVRRAWKAIR